MMMTTAQTTAATDTILAIDLGKFKSHAGRRLGRCPAPRP
jgi:hypothetical protein